MGALNDDTIKKGLDVFLDPSDSKLITHLNSCVHCGLCAESCIYYLVTKDERMIPARKVDIVSAVYRRTILSPEKSFRHLYMRVT